MTSSTPSKDLEEILKISMLINSTFETNEVLNRIMDSANRVVKAEASSILLIDKKQDSLYFYVALGDKGEEVKKFTVKMGEGIAGWVAKHSKPLLVPDVQKDDRWFKDISKKVNYQTKSILCVPLKLKDKTIGVLEVINKMGGNSFSLEDQSLLETFSNLAAISIQNARSYQDIKFENINLKKELSHSKLPQDFIGESSLIKEKLEMVDQVAPTNTTVLLLGESGTGKELFAEHVHYKSERVGKPLIKVNCAAIPENLIETELFGHVKGAFTNAVTDKMGKFELAGGGTIFLDEIGELSYSIQSKLLRVLQDHTFERVGGTTTRKVDIRLIAATNKNLYEEVSKNRFREDLFFRLNVFPIFIPPLRERREDIAPLAEYFLQRFNRELKKSVKGITPEAMNLLKRYYWPGNVRELQNVIERSVVLCKGTEIGRKDLYIESDSISVKSIDIDPVLSLKNAVNDFKRGYITKVLEKHGWKQTKASESLKIQRTYLSRLINELNISKI
ncbi:MAG: sigma 54-interacting transcriptional regulator [Spirochaetes bacterium]|nr:sigma 54-interacting transcriptional regulator [Spirochaetota bacterium]